jgi:hypothetical protein
MRVRAASERLTAVGREVRRYSSGLEGRLLGVKGDGEAESSDDGDGRGPTDHHGADGIVGLGNRGEGNILGPVGQDELVKDGEGTPGIPDGLERRGCHE